MTHLPALATAGAVAAAIRNKEVSPVEVLDDHAARIDDLNPQLNALVINDLDRARIAATEAERVLSRHEDVGVLHGVPFTVKEAIEVKDLPSCVCSRLFPREIGRADAHIVTSLRKAGAILIGKTNMSELAFFPDSVNLVYGATRNPRCLTASAGGSSGGEACAVAVGMSAFGIGSDYGGSIRAPAHCCGVAGLRTGRGAIPLQGHLPRDLPAGRQRWSTLGPIARTVADLELVMSAVAPPSQAPPDVWRVGIVEDWADRTVEPACAHAVEQACALLTAAGLELAGVDLPIGPEAERMFEEITTIETKRLLAEFLPKGLTEASPQTVAQWEAVCDVDSDEATYRELLSEADRLDRRGQDSLADDTVLLSPASAVATFELGRVDVGVFDLFPHYTLASVLGLPAVVLPVTRTVEGMPVGVQLVGRRGAEGQLLRIARTLEEAVAATGVMEDGGAPGAASSRVTTRDHRQQ